MKGKSFTALDPGGSHKGVSNTWFTPREIVEALGPFDLDPCTQTFRPFDTALVHLCEDAGDDGLLASWAGRVWLNPPYGKAVGQWLDRLSMHGNGIALVFARIDTKWAQEALRRADGVNFLQGRIAFIHRDGKESGNAGTGSMLLAYGQENVERLASLPGTIFRKGTL